MTEFVAFLIRLLTGANPQWRENSRPQTQGSVRVYYANHGSHLDFLTLWATLPQEERARTRPVAAKEYWEKTSARRWLASKIFRALLIDRQHVKRSEHPLTPLVEALAQGECLIIFPEGTRNPDGEMTEFKSGIYYLHQKYPQAELVPVYLQNLNRILPKGQFLPIPLIASVVFGSPLQEVEGEIKPNFLQRARAAILELRPSSPQN